ncbi:MAG TPA: tetratricopeptide repeat protein [Candidatus Obscuribacterales bacterium]
MSSTSQHSFAASPMEIQFGDLLVAAGFLTVEDYAEATRLAVTKSLNIRQVLVMNGYLSVPHLQSAAEAQAKINDRRITMEFAVRCLALVARTNVTFEEAERTLNQQGEAAPADRHALTLGELLFEAGVASAEELDAAMQKSITTGLPFGRVLILQSSVSESALKTALDLQVKLRDGELDRDQAVESLKQSLRRRSTPEQQIPQQPKTGIRLGELLVLARILSETDVTQALEIGLSTDQPIGWVLMNRGYVSSEILDAALRMQKLVNEGQIDANRAGQGLSEMHFGGKSFEQVLQPPQPQRAVGPREVIPFERFLTLAGVVGQDEINQAFNIGYKMPSLIAKVLLVTGFCDDNTMKSCLDVYRRLQEGVIEQDAALAHINYLRIRRQESPSDMPSGTFSAQPGPIDFGKPGAFEPSAQSAPSYMTSPASFPSVPQPAGPDLGITMDSAIDRAFDASMKILANEVNQPAPPGLFSGSDMESAIDRAFAQSMAGPSDKAVPPSTTISGVVSDHIDRAFDQSLKKLADEVNQPVPPGMFDNTIDSAIDRAFDQSMNPNAGQMSPSTSTAPISTGSGIESDIDRAFERSMAVQHQNAQGARDGLFKSESDLETAVDDAFAKSMLDPEATAIPPSDLFITHNKGQVPTTGPLPIPAPTQEPAQPISTPAPIAKPPSPHQATATGADSASRANEPAQQHKNSLPTSPLSGKASLANLYTNGESIESTIDNAFDQAMSPSDEKRAKEPIAGGVNKQLPPEAAMPPEAAESRAGSNTKTPDHVAKQREPSKIAPPPESAATVKAPSVGEAPTPHPAAPRQAANPTLPPQTAAPQQAAAKQAPPPQTATPLPPAEKQAPPTQTAAPQQAAAKQAPPAQTATPLPPAEKQAPPPQTAPQQATAVPPPQATRVEKKSASAPVELDPSVLEADPNVVLSDPAVVKSYIKLALRYRDHGNYERAENILQKVFAFRIYELGADNPELIDDLNNLSGVLCVQGKYEQAEPYVLHMLKLSQSLHPLKRANILNTLAHVYQQRGKVAEAEQVLLEEMELRHAHMSEDAGEGITDGLKDYARLLQSTNRAEEAAKIFSEVKEINDNPAERRRVVESQLSNLKRPKPPAKKD